MPDLDVIEAFDKAFDVIHEMDAKVMDLRRMVVNDPKPQHALQMLAVLQQGLDGAKFTFDLLTGERIAQR